MAWRGALGAALGGALLMTAQACHRGPHGGGNGGSAGPALIVHGGTSTPAEQTPELRAAAEAAWRALAGGATALDAVVAGCVVLEDNPEFNAGTGSMIRLDGETVQMDAAVMDSSGDFGAVAVIERVRNPIVVARAVIDTPHLILAGEGATRFARTLGLPEYDPRTGEAMARHRRQVERLRERGILNFDWESHWNYEREFEEVVGSTRDTVGAVAHDGRGGFAAAVSTGGGGAALLGRVGDVPIIGAGCYAGPAGAVCATGWGEHIMAEQLSRRVYEWIVAGATPQEAVERGVALYPGEITVGLIAISRAGTGAASNSNMAWAAMEGGRASGPVDLD